MQTLLALVAMYLILGSLFAIGFVARGAGRIDPAARGGSLGFRLIIAPGGAALWPILAWKWAAAPRMGVDR
jgi:hypothetical protein